CGVAFDGDFVVVVDPAQIVEPEVSSQRCSFAGNALHHAPIAAERVDVVVEDVEIRAIEIAGSPSPCNGHADASGDSLAQRTRRGFDAGGPAVFGMAGAFAFELTKTLDVVQRDGWFS